MNSLLIGIFFCCGFISSSPLAANENKQSTLLVNSNTDNLAAISDAMFNLLNMGDNEIKNKLLYLLTGKKQSEVIPVTESADVVSTISVIPATESVDAVPTISVIPTTERTDVVSTVSVVPITEKANVLSTILPESDPVFSFTDNTDDNPVTIFNDNDDSAGVTVETVQVVKPINNESIEEPSIEEATINPIIEMITINDSPVKIVSIDNTPLEDTIDLEIESTPDQMQSLDQEDLMKPITLFSKIRMSGVFPMHNLDHPKFIKGLFFVPNSNHDDSFNEYLSQPLVSKLFSYFANIMPTSLQSENDQLCTLC
ncbi:hypothetical protein GJ496_007638 [Pomphorhynchus laevis]|nr:hypothetical protein GJ496_007638 [Pomphorhynchus laevis]